MVFSLFAKKNSEDKTVSLLVDIGSASVGCALVKIEKGQLPHILVSTRTNIRFQDSLSSSKFLLAMSSTLEQSLRVVHAKMREQKDRMGVPAYIFCTLSSPWFLLKGRTIQISREEPFTVTEKMIDEETSKDVNQLIEGLKGTLPQSDIAIIEKKVTHLTLNGYEIKNPYGQKTKQLDLMMNVSISSLRVIQTVKQKLGHFFPTPLVHFGAFPVAAFSVVRDLFPLEKDFLFVDITGEATDISLSLNDVLVESLAFPCGKNFFLREISAKLRTSNEEANTLFSMYLRGELIHHRQAAIKKIVLHSQEEWSHRFKKAVSSFEKSGSIPKKLFFTADRDIALFFLSILSKERPPLSSEEFFEVQCIDQLLVSKFISFESGFLHDPFLTIEALLAGKIIPPQL